MPEERKGTPPDTYQVSQRILALDGLRGVAIAVVLIGHLTRDRFRTNPLLHWATVSLQNPDLGVQLFFVLSGFLITGILLGERSRTGFIGLRRFYIRRAFRILPAYYTFLLIASALVATGALSTTPADLASSFLFFSNYSPASDATWLEHTWSLAIEEQFYLLWPLLLLRLGNRKATRLAVVVVLLSPGIRVITYALTGDANYQHFQNRADSLLAGALLALFALSRPKVIEKIRSAIGRWHLISLAVCFLLATSYISEVAGGLWTLTLAWPLNASAVVLIVLAATAPTSTRTKRFLEVAPLILLGRISFSLYLWQQLFTLVDSPLPLAAGLPLMFGLAVASYLLVEKPFLRLKTRYSARSTAPR